MIGGFQAAMDMMRNSKAIPPVLNPQSRGMQLGPINTPELNPIEPGPPPGLWERAKSGLGGAFNNFFGGFDDPRLGEEGNERARRNAMLQAGLGMMHMSNNGGTFGDALTAGGMTGAKAGRSERERLYEQQMEEQMAENRRQMLGMMSPLMGMPMPGEGGGPSPELVRRARERIGQSILLSPTSMSTIASQF